MRLSVAVAFIGSSIIGFGHARQRLQIEPVPGPDSSRSSAPSRPWDLSTGIALLPDGAKYVIVALMFVGRVGTMTAASALALRERRPRYPDARSQPDDRLGRQSLTSGRPLFPGTGNAMGRRIRPLRGEQLPEMAAAPSSARPVIGCSRETEGDALDEEAI